MGHFKAFEIEVLRLLTASELGATAIDDIVLNAELVSYDYTGVGYFLTVKHPAVPSARAVFSTPTIIGSSGMTQCGFLVFVESGELILECYTAGSVEISEHFREQHITVCTT
jgi:hypothetical protein